MGPGAYYRLGKNLCGSGILSRYSRFALTIQAMPTMLARTAPMTAVLAFQFAGWAYQPPAGDQTCLGYLHHWGQRRNPHILYGVFLRDLSSATHCDVLC